MELLELIEQPAFCVQNGKVVAANRAALQHQVSVDAQIEPMIPDHKEDYRNFCEGILYLNLNIGGLVYDATVTRTEQGDIFLLDDRYSGEHLRAMALCSQHLRAQLSGVMSAVQGQSQNDGNLVRGLYKLQRAVCNMSDVAYYRSSKISMDTLEIGSVIYEIMEKAAVLLKESGTELRYSGIREQVFTAGNYELLERAVYNLLSNAVKFSEKGGIITASLSRKSKSVVLTIEDSGEGIPSNLYNTLFTRYQRQPGIEDGTHGIGLGMALVRSAAAVHGGTVLVTRAKNGGTKVTFTISVCSPIEDIVRTPAVKLSDYAGGWDHALIELSDVLPSHLYLQ